VVEDASSNRSPEIDGYCISDQASNDRKLYGIAGFDETIATWKTLKYGCFAQRDCTILFGMGATCRARRVTQERLDRQGAKTETVGKAALTGVS
jgi:hypothetical protein